ncbi:hypothetical protein ABER61_27565 [Brevibacillus formosus]|uniref:Uncharacterized protein n=3 Tax=Brevibacillus formosus TaxID=54913 RepID=A0A837KKA0_9BACL|nr:hypothetical protein [Brevibacillus formosus]KLH97502.1 hypothetical protein AA984_20425 [Brevibacillus formosus]PSJ93232.1 hypothetical protein C7R91_20860 [Brevibacillus formosus]GED60245.1 hypothetical protein BFO01nite_43770 [Brevibacillus formosus]
MTKAVVKDFMLNDWREKMLKKLSVFLLTIALASTTAMSVEGKDGNQKNDRSIEVEPGVYQVELTDKEIANYYDKIGEGMPEDQSHAGNIVKDLTEIKKEEYEDAKGNYHIVTYYSVNFKNSKEAKEVQSLIDETKALSQSQEGMIEPLGVTPTEGDVRIDVTFEKLLTGSKFDSSTKNVWTAFSAEYYRKAFDITSGYAVSNPIAGYFTGLVLTDLQNSLQGKGDAVSAYRIVHKLGQVYHKNKWQTYYDTYQREWYWKHDQLSYNANNTVKNASTAWYYPDDQGYLPFSWATTSDFNNNTRIQDVALYQYSLNPNGTTPARDFYRTENYRSDWKAKGRMNY